MTTRDTIQGYFNRLKQKNGWESFLSEDMRPSPASPVRSNGSAERSRILTHYELKPPVGPGITSDVAEVFGVRDGAITSFDIYFDSSPFPK